MTYRWPYYAAAAGLILSSLAVGFYFGAKVLEAMEDYIS